MTETSSYYSHIRHDVLAHVPPNVKRVLSIGCGEGQTEAQLVARGVQVTAIELNPVAAKVAAPSATTTSPSSFQRILKYRDLCPEPR